MFLTSPDLLIIIILSFFTFNGFNKGFIEEMSRIISWIGGLILAAKLHYLLIPVIANHIASYRLQITISYMCIFITTFILITIVAKILQKFIELILLGWLNRLLGLLIGLLKGFLIIGLIIFIIENLPLKLSQKDTIRQKLENESIMYQLCFHVKEMVILTLPTENNFDTFKKNLKEDLKEENIQKLLKEL